MRSADSCCVAGRAGVLEVEALAARPEQLRDHLRRRAELVVAVRVGLHDARVHAERHVVDEDAAGAACRGRRAVRSPWRTRRARRRRRRGRRRGRARGGCGCPAGMQTYGRSCSIAIAGDERLRAVAAGHPDHVGAAARPPSRASASRSSSGTEHDRLDPPLLRLVDQVELLDLAAARTSGSSAAPAARPAGARTPGGGRSRSAFLSVASAKRARIVASAAIATTTTTARGPCGCRSRIHAGEHDHRDRRRPPRRSARGAPRVTA